MWLSAETLERVLTPNFEEPERCSAHGHSFMRLHGSYPIYMLKFPWDNISKKLATQSFRCVHFTTHSISKHNAPSDTTLTNLTIKLIRLFMEFKVDKLHCWPLLLYNLTSTYICDCDVHIQGFSPATCFYHGWSYASRCWYMCVCVHACVRAHGGMWKVSHSDI